MKIKLSENLCRPEDMKCLKETDETLYCIVAKTLDGKTKFYKDGAFIDDYTNCTTFNDLDEARAEWFDIDKSKYKRVFVPIYDPEAFKKHLTESGEARSNRQKLKAYFAAQGKTLNVEENLKKHETQNESLLEESRSVKVDEDTANEIALMAMRAMRLKEHEAQALEYDLIEGNADKWIKDFEALPDNSDVKKLFFTFAVKTNEGLKESAELTTREKLQKYFDGGFEPKTMDAAARASDVEDIDSASTDVADEVDTTVYVDKQGKEHKGMAAKVFRYLDSLEESKESETCCICKQPIKGYGNNAEPVCSGRCCDKCNMDVVLPARVKAFRNRKNEDLELDDDDIDGTLTESYSDEMTNFMNWIQTYRDGALWDAFAKEFEAEQDPDIDAVLHWLETFDETAYYDYVDADDLDDDIDDYYANF